MEFKIGDRVRCIRPGIPGTGLILGSTYKIKRCYDSDSGTESVDLDLPGSDGCGWYANRFELVQDIGEISAEYGKANQSPSPWQKSEGPRENYIFFPYDSNPENFEFLDYKDNFGLVGNVLCGAMFAIGQEAAVEEHKVVRAKEMQKSAEDRTDSLIKERDAWKDISHRQLKRLMQVFVRARAAGLNVDDIL